MGMNVYKDMYKNVYSTITYGQKSRINSNVQQGRGKQIVVQYTHTMEYYVAIKKMEYLSSQKHISNNILDKKVNTKEYLLCNYVYVKF